MPIRYTKKLAHLEGAVAVDDAQGLADWLRQTRGAAVHLAHCEQVHAAVLQVLLALRPRLASAPADARLAGALAAAVAAAP